jgi:hypothetical protein
MIFKQPKYSVFDTQDFKNQLIGLDKKDVLAHLQTFRLDNVVVLRKGIKMDADALRAINDYLESQVPLL